MYNFTSNLLSSLVFGILLIPYAFQQIFKTFTDQLHLYSDEIKHRWTLFHNWVTFEGSRIVLNVKCMVYDILFSLFCKKKQKT